MENHIVYGLLWIIVSAADRNKDTYSLFSFSSFITTQGITNNSGVPDQSKGLKLI